MIFTLRFLIGAAAGFSMVVYFAAWCRALGQANDAPPPPVVEWLMQKMGENLGIMTLLVLGIVVPLMAMFVIGLELSAAF